MSSMKEIVEEHISSYDHLSKKHIHPRMQRMMEMGGMNVAFQRAEGPYMYDLEGNRYLDLLAGGGVYFIGRHHPKVRAAIREVNELDIPNLTVINASVLGGVLASKIIDLLGPGFSKVQFSNSGSESNEVAIRFARFCTRRRRFLYLDGAFHGRTYAAISMCGFQMMKEGMDPRMPTTTPITPNDLDQLRYELSKGDVAAFIFECTQGMTLTNLEVDYLREARRLCDEHGTLMIADEVQTGFARMGDHWFAFQESGIVPDMITLSKTLSGGAAPVACTAIGDHVYDTVFNTFKSGPIYFSTFAENNIAMAAALATIEVLEEMDAPTRAAELSKKFRDGLFALKQKHDCIERIGGKGLMIGIYFKTSESNPILRAQQSLLNSIDKGTFGAAVNVDMYRKHKIIVQIPGPGLNAIKILPPVTLSDEDVQYFLTSLDQTLADMYSRAGGPAVSLGRTVIKDQVKTLGAKLGLNAGKR
ncbi:MAG: ornithine--oxo-acid transaminase [Kiritimatiellia bacterium]|jgi:ornithine--oxo-acid transaminase